MFNFIFNENFKCLIKESNLAKNCPKIFSPRKDLELAKTQPKNFPARGWDEPWSTPVNKNSPKQQPADKWFVADNRTGKPSCSPTGKPRQGSSSSLKRSNFSTTKQNKKLSLTQNATLESGKSKSSLQMSRARSQLNMGMMKCYDHVTWCWLVLIG